MKILMALMGLDIGGAETHVVELSKELSRRGHDIIVASNGGVYEKTLEACGVRHERIPMHRRSLGSMVKSLRLLKALIAREKPDLVHAHARIPGFLCGILHKTMGFPFITSAHWVFNVTPLLRLMTNWGQRTVAVSDDIKSYLMHNYQVPEDQIHVTINGIDTGDFAPREKDPVYMETLGLGTGPIIGTVSRLDESRELAARQLIAVMPELLKSFPHAQLLIVGGGNMEDVLRKEAEEVNHAAGRNAIIMTGPRTDIAELVTLCDIFVGVSRSALEAMAAEKPVILAGNEGYTGIFHEGELPEAQKGNFCCRGFDPICPETLLKDLVTLLDMPEDAREALGRFGRQVVLEHYSVARMTDDYLFAYHQLLNPPEVIRAAVSGYYGYGNLGDDAILSAISQQLRSPEKPVRLMVLSRHPKETKKNYGLPAVQRFSPWAVYRALKKSDVLISGGGSLIQDRTSTRSLLYYLSVIRLAKLLKKPVFLYANGVGPLLQKRNREKVRRCIETCDKITLRDRESLQELQRLGVTREDIEITGDPVFALKLPAMDQKPLVDMGIPEGSAVVGISVRRLPRSEHFAHEFAVLCDRLVQEKGKTVVFLVMQESEDEAISQRIRQEMTQKSYLAKSPGDPNGMLSIIRDMELVICMRLHTLVFAANTNVPVVGCAYDPKVSAILGLLQMPSCGTPDDMNAEETFRIVEDMLGRLPEYKLRLEKNILGLVDLAEKNSELFRQMMQETD